jgi:large subunit ribosomal protein L21
MYAVVRTGGKQVRVEPGDVVSVELLEGEPGQRIELTDVLLVGCEGDLKVGTPTVEGAKVLAEIEGESKGPKIRIFKFKRRKRYRLRQGHRQHYTRIRIESIEV